MTEGSDKPGFQSIASAAEGAARFGAERGAPAEGSLNREGCWEVVPPRLSELLGLSAEVFRNCRLETRVYPPDIKKLLAGLDDILGGRRSASVRDIRFVRQDGALLWLQVSLTGCGADHPVGVQVVDISRAAEAVEELRESEACYRTLVEKSPEALFIYDTRQAGVTYLNERARELFGLEQVPAANQPTKLSAPTQIDGRPAQERIRELADEVIQTGRVSVEWLFQDRQGNEFEAELRLNRLDGTRAHLVQGRISDISERRQIDNARLDALKRVQEQQAVIVELATLDAVQKGDMEGAARVMTEAAAMAARVERVSVWLLNEDETELRCVDLYRLSRNEHIRPPALRAESYPAYFAAVKSQRTVTAHDAVTDPRTREFNEDYLQKTGITSMLDAGARVAGRIRGVVCFEHVGPPRGWSADETSFVGEIADLVAHVLLCRERHQAMVAVRSNEQRYRTLYEDNPSLIFTVDPDGRILEINRSGAQQLGYSRDKLLGRQLSDFQFRSERAATRQRLALCLASPHATQRWETCLAGKNGSLLWVRVNARALKGHHKEGQVLVVCQNVTETRELSAELHYQTTHDLLTGLLNRREFEQVLSRAMERIQGDTEARAVLCYLNLDQFKLVNQAGGHAAGDALIRSIATLLAEYLGENDMAARVGGDEFALLLCDRSLQDCQALVEEMRQAVERFSFRWEEQVLRVSASIGLVPLSEKTVSVGKLLSQADNACYAAKELGRNRVHVYQAADTTVARRHGEMRWVITLRKALDEQRLQLYFQRIKPVGAPAMHGESYELLLRLQDVTGRIVSPGAFLLAAERYDLMERIDAWVVTHALEWLAAHPQQLERLSLCAINLSGQSLGSQKFLTAVTQSLKDNNVPPEKLCFEITETLAIRNHEGAMRLIRYMKGLGCRFALDDFGTGLSSFDYLKRLPVDYVKIDGLFVKDVAKNPSDLVLVKSINDVAHALGKQTIAEFVETQAALTKLRQIGVDYAQGFGLHRPQPLNGKA